MRSMNPLNTLCDWGNGEVEAQLEFIEEDMRVVGLHEDELSSSYILDNTEDYYISESGSLTTFEDLESFGCFQRSSYNPDEL